MNKNYHLNNTLDTLRFKDYFKKTFEHITNCIGKYNFNDYICDLYHLLKRFHQERTIDCFKIKVVVEYEKEEWDVKESSILYEEYIDLDSLDAFNKKKIDYIFKFPRENKCGKK